MNRGDLMRYWKKLLKNYPDLKGLNLQIVLQQAYQQKLKLDKQEIILPFTNNDCCVLLQKVDGQWHYVTRWSALWAEEDSERIAVIMEMLLHGKITSFWKYEMIALDLKQGEIFIKKGRAADIYGDGKIMPPTADCQVLIAISPSNRAWFEVVRVYRI